MQATNFGFASCACGMATIPLIYFVLNSIERENKIFDVQVFKHHFPMTISLRRFLLFVQCSDLRNGQCTA